jgi:hypothetical protein
VIKKETAYHVASANSKIDLEREVTRYLQCGWQLQGGVSVTSTNRDGDTVDTWYAQALVYSRASRSTT